MNSCKIKGSKGENFAARFLESKGFVIKHKNYHSRYGEIDLIAENSEIIVFAEVKTRKKFSRVRGIESIGKSKRIRIIKTAFVYLINNPSKKQPRFDVAEIAENNKGELQNINYIENAFDAGEYNAFF